MAVDENIGKKFIVNLGELRGREHPSSVGFFPESMLEDGSIVTIATRYPDEKMWYSIEEDPYWYHMDILIPVESKTRKSLRVLHECTHGS